MSTREELRLEFNDAWVAAWSIADDVWGHAALDDAYVALDVAKAALADYDKENP